MISKTKTTFPVSLADARKHLRLDDDFTDDDEEINLLIEVATQLAEDYLNKDIALTTNTLKLYDFLSDTIEVNESNLIEVVSVKDEYGNSYTWDKFYVWDSHFEIELDSTPSGDPLTVVFTTGFESGKCPKPIIQAIKVKIWDLYDIGRSSHLSQGVTDTKLFERLLDSYQAKIVKYRREC
jgi:hypothetical protein